MPRPHISLLSLFVIFKNSQLEASSIPFSNLHNVSAELKNWSSSCFLLTALSKTVCFISAICASLSKARFLPIPPGVSFHQPFRSPLPLEITGCPGHPVHIQVSKRRLSFLSLRDWLALLSFQLWFLSAWGPFGLGPKNIVTQCQSISIKWAMPLFLPHGLI